MAQADYEALNRVVGDFDAYWAANASRHAMCTASAAKVAFDTCFRGCVAFDCDAAGRVMSLRLDGRDTLYGGAAVQSVRSQIGLLTALTSLATLLVDVAVPTQVGLLTNLVSVALISQFGAATSLPTAIGGWTKLTSLTLYTPSLMSLPTQVGRLTALTSLHLQCRSLAGLPTQLGRLQALNDVHLRVESGMLPGGWSAATFVSFRAENSSLSGKIPLFTFDGAPGACMLRLNAFDNATSLCPLGCSCDRNIVPQPLPTLVGSGNASEIDGSFDWVIAALVVGGMLLGVTVGVVVWLTIALRSALRRIMPQHDSGVATEMYTARSVRAPSTTVAFAPTPPSGHYVSHASEIHAHMGGNSVRQYDALTAVEAGHAVASDYY